MPSAPGGVGAVAGDGEATVSWTAPNDGGSPITSYTVTPYVGGKAELPQSFESSATTEAVTGLSNGTSYSFTVTATNVVGSGPPSAASPAVVPMAPMLKIVNGAGGQPGRAQQGDQVVITFSPVPSLSELCSAWTQSSHPSLDDPNVVVQGTQPSSGDDTLTVTDSVDCTGGLHLGSIDLGQRGYFNTGTATFGGSSLTCLLGVLTSGCASIEWSGDNTLAITLGTASSGQPTQAAESVVVYTPDAALGLSGPIASDKEENF